MFSIYTKFYYRNLYILYIQKEHLKNKIMCNEINEIMNKKLQSYYRTRRIRYVSPLNQYVSMFQEISWYTILCLKTNGQVDEAGKQEESRSKI